MAGSYHPGSQSKRPECVGVCGAPRISRDAEWFIRGVSIRFSIKCLHPIVGDGYTGATGDMIGWVLQPFCNRWKIFIPELCTALDMTPHIDCSRVAAVPKLQGLGFPPGQTFLHKKFGSVAFGLVRA